MIINTKLLNISTKPQQYYTKYFLSLHSTKLFNMIPYTGDGDERKRAPWKAPFSFFYFETVKAIFWRMSRDELPTSNSKSPGSTTQPWVLSS